MRAIYISSNAFPVRQLDAIFAACDEHHIDRLELGSGVAYDADARKKIIARSKRTNIVLHNYIPAPQEPFVLNLASNEKDITEKSIALATEALHISAEINAPLYAVHSGFAYRADAALLGGKQNHLQHISLQEAEKYFNENIHRLSLIAKETGVRLLVENNSLPAFNLIGGENRSLLVAGIEDSLTSMRLFSQWHVGLLVDLGHVKVAAAALGYDPINYVQVLREYIAAFHIHDNDGTSDQHMPSDRQSWYLKSLSTFPDDVLFTLETNDHLQETLESQELF